VFDSQYRFRGGGTVVGEKENSGRFQQGALDKGKLESKQRPTPQPAKVAELIKSIASLGKRVKDLEKK
jgi:hypothetical protein